MNSQKSKIIKTHIIGEDVLSQQVYEPVSFLLSNEIGGYFSIPAKGSNLTKFHGAFFCDPHLQGWTIFKTIESINHQKEIEEIKNKIWEIERLGQGFLEKFFMPYYYNTLIYETEGLDEIELILDVREVHDFSTTGRIYYTYKEDNNIIIEYTKHHGHTSNVGHSKSYKTYVIIDSDTIEGYEELNEWTESHYELDKYRKSEHADWWVYKAIKLKLKPNSKIVFSYGHDKEKATNLASYVKRNTESLRNSQKKYVLKVIDTQLDIEEKNIRTAYKCALNALDDLTVTINGKHGMYAGLWWFFQWWSRDEAQSLKALMLENRLNEVKEILFREIEVILEDGRVPNRYPFTNLGSADGVGWTFKRFYDFIELLQKKGKLEEYLNISDILAIQGQLEDSITKIRKHHMNEDGLVTNGPMETWMDTSIAEEKDDRRGARIEIQALTLAMYQLMQKLSEITENQQQLEKYKKIEQETAQKVKEKFWNGERLLDGIEDEIIRPNIFIAAYIYPQLLNKEEWTQCIQKSLSKLWCNWEEYGGGIATIDKESELFYECYTGESPESYHRGDSWYFLNNMAAIVMHRINPEIFKDYIEKITKSSTYSLLFQGLVGHLAELSSAAGIEANASPAQAWSEAFYIELINELFSKKE